MKDHGGVTGGNRIRPLLFKLSSFFELISSILPRTPTTVRLSRWGIRRKGIYGEGAPTSVAAASLAARCEGAITRMQGQLMYPGRHTEPAGAERTCPGSEVPRDRVQKSVRSCY